MKPHIVIKPSAPGFRFEVYMPGAKGDGYRDEKMRLLVASGKRSTRALAETAAAREAAVYFKMHAKKGSKR